MICVGKYLHEEQRSAQKFGIIGKRWYDPTAPSRL